MTKKIDKQNMYKVINESPEQLKAGLELAKNIKMAGDFKNIVFCAIGGSALPINVLNTIIKPTIPTYIHRDYNLPEWITGDSLIVCISYSGNTEEGLSCLKEATDKNLKVVAISSGGKFEEIAKQKNIPFVKLPSGIQPRLAIGYIFSAVTKILINSGLVKDISFEIQDTVTDLNSIKDQLEKESKKIAKKIAKKIPIIYSSDSLKILARIWKIKFNENSKIPAFYNYFPELNHNEMVGYTNIKKFGAKNFAVIILQNESENPRILKRIKLTLNVIKKSGIKTEVIQIKNGNTMFKVFSTILLGDWVSYFVAINQKIDPSPVDLVEEFKKQMAK